MSAGEGRGHRVGPIRTVGRASMRAERKALMGHPEEETQVLVLPLVSSVALLLSKPPWPHLCNEDNNTPPGG